LKFVKQQDQMTNIAAEPFQSPAHQHIEPTTPSVSDQLIQSRSAILGSADASVDILLSRPAPSLDISPEFLKLVLGLLIERTDARVYSRSHCRSFRLSEGCKRLRADAARRIAASRATASSAVAWDC
jgi:hypothetical protein